MSNPELEVFVRRANEIGRAQYEGFCSCSIHTTNPPVIVYDFESGLDADAFMLARQTLHSQYRLEHSTIDERRVFEYRSQEPDKDATTRLGVESDGPIILTLKLLATPIDFQSLIENGIVKKSGRWYTLLQPDRLPVHARQQVIAIASGSDGLIKIRFSGTTKKAAALYKKITGKSPVS